jgi:type IV secretory pathway TraG/TraD family ATPase VirD4
VRENDAWVAIGIGAAIVAAFTSAAWAAWWAAARWSSAPAAPDGPPAMVKALVSGETTWPVAATWWGLGFALVLVAVLVLVVVRLGDRRQVDRSARRLARGSGAKRYIKGTGPVIGRLVSGSTTGRRPVVRMTIEDQATIVAGPRTGKTTALAIPAALGHHGPLLVTSNKRDIYDATAETRARQGKVWLFDPQQLGGSRTTSPPWWWNPLTVARDVRGARRLAAIWSNASKAPGARSDAYFDPEGEELLAGLLLAAAVDDRPLSAVYEWLASPNDPTPVDILSRTPGVELMAQGLAGRQALPDKQRAGVYGTAGKLVSWLADADVRAWVEQGSGPHFDPAAFVASTDTLLSLSREGEASAAPLVTALTAAVLEAAERHAATLPGGRLSVPLLGVLDEAANVCRWRELPDLYSHYGSRGIVLMGIFQSWAQMVEAFGPQGAEKLWSAANVRVYGGGVGDTAFLRRLSELAGDYDATVRSSSVSRHGGSRSRSVQRRPIYSVAALGALPPGRALVLLSAADPVLVELVPWWQQRRRGRQSAPTTTAESDSGGITAPEPVAP